MNKKYMYTLLIVLGVVLIGWFLYSWLSVRIIEEPNYEVISKANGYEIREYSSYILAQTEVTDAIDRSDAARKGFSIVAGYIFGDNTTKDKIAMTTPVNTKERSGIYIISFVMPSEYTLETLPTPNDSRVKWVEVPSHEVAVKRFSWSVTENRMNKFEEKLLSELSRDGVETVGEVNIARYNPPWTIPFMLRNEVQINIK